MKELKTLQLLILMNAYIYDENTGTPTQFANKINRSISSIHRLVNVMKNAGAPIKYCRQLQSYFFTENGNFIVGFVKE